MITVCRSGLRKDVSERARTQPCGGQRQTHYIVSAFESRIQRPRRVFVHPRSGEANLARRVKPHPDARSLARNLGVIRQYGYMSGLTDFQLLPLPDAPAGRCPEVRQPWRYLTATHETVGGLLESFALVRERANQEKRSPRGRLSADQVDLLRAALVFTSSGLDATCQSLLMQALPRLISVTGVAQEKYTRFIEMGLKSPNTSSELTSAVMSSDPRGALIDVYVAAKTRSSFQGSADLKDRVKGSLGLPSKTLSAARFSALDGFFKARNDIVHQLDYEAPSSTSRRRYHRAPADVTATCDNVLTLLADLIKATGVLLKSK